MRMTAAHDGNGLSNSNYGYGSSPYGYGTTVAQGYFKQPGGPEDGFRYDQEMADGTCYRDLDDAPFAAGSTGWSAIWVGACGNVFSHELGHSLTLSHFDKTGEGVCAQGNVPEDKREQCLASYPDGGWQSPTLPWGYDTQRRALRTWYRVDGNGPVYGDPLPSQVAAVSDEASRRRMGIQDGDVKSEELADVLQHKSDTMNGGKWNYDATCYAQFTPVHAQRAQTWAAATPVPLSVDGVPDVYTWDTASHQYLSAAQGAGQRESGASDAVLDARPALLAYGVPALTIWGAISTAVSRIYPPVPWAAANVFALRSPFAADLPAIYSSGGGGQHFLKIFFSDGGDPEYALIAKPEQLGDEGWGNYVATFSVNVALSRQPSRVELYLAATPYPAIVEDDEQHTLLHARDLELVDASSLRPALHFGGAQGRMGAEAGLWLRTRCGEGAGLRACDETAPFIAWRPGKAQLYFTVGDESGAPTACAAAGAYSTLLVPVVNDEGEEATVTVHSQRWVSAPGVPSRFSPLDDATPWLGVANSEQGIRAWLPNASNADLPDGRWRAVVDVHAWARRDQLSRADELVDSVRINIDIDIRPVGCDVGGSMAGYDGSLAVTESGRTCQDWAIISPERWHGSYHLPRNYCRDPSAHGILWCYTSTEPTLEWEYCRLPTCTMPPSPPLPPFAPDPPSLPSVLNLGEECWRSCYGQSGPCETGFCGANGVCCRIGYDAHLLSCGFGTLGCDGNHCCSAPSESPEEEEGKICLNTDDGAVDSFGDPCTVYDWFTEFCTYSDDDDFTSTSMCCACGGGVMVDAPPPAPDGTYVYDPYAGGTYVHDPYAGGTYVYDPTAGGGGTYGGDPWGGDAYYGGDAYGGDPWGEDAYYGGDPWGGDAYYGGDPWGGDAYGGDPWGGDPHNDTYLPPDDTDNGS